MPRSMLAGVREVGEQAIHERLAEVLAPVRSQLLERLAPEEGARVLDLNTYEGSAEYLPFDDGDFDVVVSTFAFIWAPDHANVASELARVLPPRGRLGFTAWKPNPKLGELYRRFSEEPLEGRESTEWGREDHVEAMLGDDFELDFEDGTLWLDVESGEDLWQLFSHSSPPVVSMLRRLGDGRSEEFHRAFVELFESYRDGARVRAPRRYLMTFGRRR
jgi:SAM-dependent methyltransferase